MNSNLVVLVSALNGDIDKIVNNAHFESDAIIVNQTDNEKDYKFDNNGYTVRVINSKSLGVAISRNIAKNAALDIGYKYLLFSDDDVSFYPNYKNDIERVLSDHDNIDMLFLEIDESNNGIKNQYIKNIDEETIRKILRPHVYVGTVRIAIKTEFLRTNNIQFDKRFGPGSNEYSHGEDSVFIKDCRNSGALIAKTNIKIASVDFSNSTWRNISFSKHCSDKGALWKVLSQNFYWFYGLILIKKMASSANEKFISNYMMFLQGAKHIKKSIKGENL